MRREIEVRVFEVSDCEEFDCVEEIVDEECEDCCCECCPYTDDEDDEDPELEYITDKVQELIDCGMCPDCALGFVVDLYETAYDNGFEDFRLGLVEDLLTEDED